jgi:hypothetical protein
MFKLSFNYDNHLYPDLFERSKKIMRVYGGNILQEEKNYIS